MIDLKTKSYLLLPHFLFLYLHVGARVAKSWQFFNAGFLWSFGFLACQLKWRQSFNIILIKVNKIKLCFPRYI